MQAAGATPLSGGKGLVDASSLLMQLTNDAASQPRSNRSGGASRSSRGFRYDRQDDDDNGDGGGDDTWENGAGENARRGAPFAAETTQRRRIATGSTSRGGLPPEQQTQPEYRFGAFDVPRKIRVSHSEHLQRLYALVCWSDRNNQGQWMGVRRFIDAYFSTIFHPYFGATFRMNVVHVARMRKLGAHFVLCPRSRSYTVMVLMNYPLWDKLLTTAAALPDRYFTRSTRSTLNADLANAFARWETEKRARPGSYLGRRGGADDDGGIDRTAATSGSSVLRTATVTVADYRVPGSNNDTGGGTPLFPTQPFASQSRSTNGGGDSGDGSGATSTTTRGDATLGGGDVMYGTFSGGRRLHSERFSLAMNVSLGALCLVDRLEESMRPDLELAEAGHVMTLSKFFSNTQCANKRIFETHAYLD